MTSQWDTEITEHLHIVHEAFIMGGWGLVGSPNLQHIFSQETQQYVR